MVAIGLLLLPLMLLGTLFMDLGRIYVLRTEAQLAADAAALAGGSAFIDGPGEGGAELVVARVHQYVNDNRIGGQKAAVDSIAINVPAASVRVVLGYETGPLLLGQGGLRLLARAGAKVFEASEATEAPTSGPEPEKRLRLIN
jgi:hypothetical protein